jgi:NTE family protein
MTDEFEAFNAAHPEHRTFNGKDLAFVPTVFDRLDPDLVDALIYRGWWLTGATLAQFHPGMTERQAANPPPLAVD